MSMVRQAKRRAKRRLHRHPSLEKFGCLLKSWISLTWLPATLINAHININRPRAVGVVMPCCYIYTVVIESLKAFFWRHRCARTQAAILTWRAQLLWLYMCVYMIQICKLQVLSSNSLKSLDYLRARTQAATLTWFAYHDFTLCVYVANMQTSLKSLLVFACTAMFLSISAIHFVYTNMATTTRTYLES